MAAEQPLDLDLVAASLRADASDIAAFVEALAVKLEQALPGAVRVERARRGFRGPRWVREISLDAGGLRLILRRNEADAVQCSASRVSGGIVLKTEPVELERWIEQLGRALVEEAGRSLRTREALERLMLGAPGAGEAQAIEPAPAEGRRRALGRQGD
jgi:hypothetical protein